MDFISEVRKDAAWHLGKADYRDGKCQADNPYPPSNEHDAWDWGWRAAYGKTLPQTNSAEQAS